MDKYVFTKKENIPIRLNGNVLSGVFDFKIENTSKVSGFYEIFNSNPFAETTGENEYTVTLKNYGAMIKELKEENFDLSFKVNDDRIIRLINCNAIENTTSINSDGKLVSATKLIAKEMIV